VYSKQAEEYMKILRPLIPSENAVGKMLTEWDLTYNKTSKIVGVFEEFYEELLLEVFGKLIGENVWSEIWTKTSAFYHYYDKIILDGSAFTSTDNRDAVFKRVILNVLKDKEVSKLTTWGSQRTLYMENLFFGDKFHFLTR
jgi:hypothetical protein